MIIKNGNTHGVSSMTRHTHAMVLRQSVVSSMGKVLFWGGRQTLKQKKAFIEQGHKVAPDYICRV